MGPLLVIYEFSSSQVVADFSSSASKNKEHPIISITDGPEGLSPWHTHHSAYGERQCRRQAKSTGPWGPEVGSQSHVHLRRAKEVRDGAHKQARWTPIVPIAQNRSSVRLHCRIVHKHPLLLLTAVSRPLLAIPPRSPVAGASCARKFRVDIRTSYRPPEGLPARRSAGPRGGCGVLCLLHVVCVLYDRDHYTHTPQGTPISNRFCAAAKRQGSCFE